MPLDVREVVARRGDLGTFVVHMTRDREGTSSKEALKQILQTRTIRATSPFGHAVKKLEQAHQPTDSQKTACFTETPLEYVYLLLNEISGRQVALRPYGVAVTKKVAREGSVNPVWYIDQTPGHHWIGNEVNLLVDAAITAGDFDASPIAKICPFIEQMGTHRNADGTYAYRKEFWWEREWRKLGDYRLPDTFIVLCPTADRVEVQAVAPPGRTASFIDPAWGLERIIAALAGFTENEVEML